MEIGARGARVNGGKDLRKRYLLSLEWKRVGVMDNDSGDDETDELRTRTCGDLLNNKSI